MGIMQLLSLKRSIAATLLLSSSLLSSSLLWSSEAIAAERVVFRYRGFTRSIPVEQLAEFATTGETTPALDYYLDRSDQDPEALRRLLTRPIAVDPVTLDRALNNPLGDIFLDRVGETIRTRSNTANREALRSALVLSASQDNQISLLEIVQNYPTATVQIEGESLLQAYQQVSLMSDRIQNILDWIRTL